MHFEKFIVNDIVKTPGQDFFDTEALTEGGTSNYQWGEEFNIRVLEWFAANSPDSYLNWYQGPLDEIHSHIYGNLFNWLNPDNLDPNMSPVMRRIYNKPEFIVLPARLKLLSYLGHPQHQSDITCDQLTQCIDLNAIIPFGVVAWDPEMDFEVMKENAEHQIIVCGGTMPAEATKFFYDLKKEAFILSQKIWPAFGTQQPGAFQASLNINDIWKIHEDLLHNWHDCLRSNGFPDSFNDMIYHSAFVSSLSEDHTILPFDNIGALLAEKLTSAFTSVNHNNPPVPGPTNPPTTIGAGPWIGVSKEIAPEDLLHATYVMDEQLETIEEFFISMGVGSHDAMLILDQAEHTLRSVANNDDGTNPDHINWFQGSLEDINAGLEQTLAHLAVPQPMALEISNLPEFVTLLTQLQLMADIGDPENKDLVDKDQFKNIDWWSIIPSGTTAETYDPTMVLWNVDGQMAAVGGTPPADIVDKINRTYDELFNIDLNQSGPPAGPATNPPTTIGTAWIGIGQEVYAYDLPHVSCLMDEQLHLVEQFFVAYGVGSADAAMIKDQARLVLESGAVASAENPDNVNWFQGSLDDINGALEMALADLAVEQPDAVAISSMPDFATLITQLQLMAYIGHPANKDRVDKDQFKNIDWNSIIPPGTTVDTFDAAMIFWNIEDQIAVIGGITPDGLADQINQTHDELINIAPYQFASGTTAAPVNDETENWYSYIDGSMGPGWELDMTRIELVLRALHQWGEGNEPGFTTLEDFCAFDFSQIISCDAHDPANYDPGHLGAVIADLGFPHAIYDKLNESDKVHAHPTGHPATTAPPPDSWCPYQTHDGCGCPPGKAWNYKGLFKIFENVFTFSLC